MISHGQTSDTRLGIGHGNNVPLPPVSVTGLPDRTDLLTTLEREVAGLMPSWVEKWHLALHNECVTLYVVPIHDPTSEECRILRVSIGEHCDPLETRLRVCQSVTIDTGKVSTELRHADSGAIFGLSSINGAIPDRTKFVITPYVRARAAPGTAQPPRERRPSQAALFREVRRSLPREIEPLRVLHYQMGMQQGSLDVLVLKLQVPQHKEASLQQWRDDFEEKFNTTVFVSRVRTVESVKSQVRNLARNAPIIGRAHMPAIAEVLENLCGKPPASSPPLAPHGVTIDLTYLPFLAIDGPYVRDREDALHAEMLPSGNIRLRAAFVDVTHIVTPGSAVDRYAQRLGSTIYGSHRQIPTLGADLAHGAASFKAGEARSAWVIELILSPEGQILNSHLPTVQRALVRVAEYVDPNGSDLVEAIGEHPALQALAQAAGALQKNRLQSTRIIRVAGEGIGHTIVAESMIAAKMALGTFGATLGMNLMYRVHAPPSPAARESLVRQLEKLKIPAAIEDFDNPLEVTGILRCLETKGQPEAVSLASQILDVFLLRSHFSVTNLGHYALGIPAGEKGGYPDIKPRDASGLTNQFQLDALFRGTPGFSWDELQSRTSTRNLRNWSRDQKMYKLHFFEMLNDKLPLEGELFPAKVVDIRDSTIMLEVAEFSRWGMLPVSSPADLLSVGSEVTVKLRGFNVSEMRFQFSGI